MSYRVVPLEPSGEPTDKLIDLDRADRNDAATNLAFSDSSQPSEPVSPALVSVSPQESRKRNIVLSVVGILFLLLCGVVFTFIIIGSNRTYEHNFGCTTNNHYATKIGYDVLKRGGNVVDALVAIQSVLTLTEPSSSGFGGGCFVVIRWKDGRVTAIDGREEAPFASNGTKPISLGGAASGVPGTVHAVIGNAFAKYGSLTLDSLLLPAINLARNGWVLDELTHEKFVDYRDTFMIFPSTRKLLLTGPNNTVPPVGTVMRNPDYARFLQTLLNEGWQSFYNGSLAQVIVNAIRNDAYRPGVMTMEDMAVYRSVQRQPLNVTWRDFQVYGMPMPSSGSTTMIAALKLLDFVFANNYTLGKNDSSQSIGLLLNCLSVAFADRDAWTADADWEDVPLMGLMDDDYLRERAKLVNYAKAVDVCPYGTPPGAGEPLPSSGERESKDTTHFNIIDSYGNIAAITSTIEQNYGSGLVVEGLGFFLNNELSDFSVTGKNRIEGGKRMPRRTALYPDNTTLGGKRPRSSMTPTILMKNNQPYLLVGSPGGSSIIGIVLNILTNLFDYNLSLKDSILAPRYISRNTGTWSFENTLFYNKDLMQNVTALGVNVTEATGHGLGAVTAILFNPDGTLSAAADPRRGGSALVYNGTIFP